jgi:branched-subunit amino acid aminotransferase/4-amino-4-deoxychorismate lyase
MAADFFLCNGQSLAMGSAVFSLAHRGSRLGEGAFDTVRIEGRHLCLFDRHVARLRHQAVKWGIFCPDVSQWQKWAATLLELHPKWQGGFMRLSLALSGPSFGYRCDEKASEAIYCVELIEKIHSPQLEKQIKPMILWFQFGQRDWLPPRRFRGQKSLQSSGYICAAKQAVVNGCY